MKKNLPCFAAVLGLALIVTGCETDSIATRTHEKSAAYAGLKTWQKRFINDGIVATKFSPDMVYMAVGNPSTKETFAGGEIWIYRHYYPTVAADRVKYNLNSESSLGHSQIIGGVLMESAGGIAGGQQVAGSAKGGVSPSMLRGGGPQGGSMEPADLVSYTLVVTFQNGLVTKLKIDPN